MILIMQLKTFFCYVEQFFLVLTLTIKFIFHEFTVPTAPVKPPLASEGFCMCVGRAELCKVFP